MPLVAQGLAAGVLVLSALGLGLRPARAASTMLRLPKASAIACVPAFGLSIMGSTTFVLGTFGLLGAWIPLGLGAVAAVLVASDKALPSELTAVLRSGQAAARKARWLWSLVGIFVLMLTVATFAPSIETDEITYHWPAAVDWAERGSFGDSPYRHVDGFPLMEVLYTSAATMTSLTGGHVLHLLCLAMLLATVVGICASVGVGDGGLVAAAVLGMPVVVNQAYVAYNDLASAAFALLAVAVVLASPWRRQNVLGAAVFLAVAVSIKPTAAVAVGSIAAILVLEPVLIRRRSIPWRMVCMRVAMLTAFVTATVGAWTLRRYVVTGELLDPVLTGPQSADALTRQSDIYDKLLMPLMPFVLGFTGATGPWGGRVGLTLGVLLLGSVVLVLARRADGARLFAYLAVPAYVHWLVIGWATDTPRTRFSIVVWCLLLVAVASVVLTRPPRRGGLAVWSGLAVLGMIDNGFEVLRKVRAINSDVAAPPAPLAAAAGALVAVAVLGVVVRGMRARLSPFRLR